MQHREKPCMISCGIFKTEIEHLLETGDIDAEVHFLSERLHMDYSLLDRGLNKALKNVLLDALAQYQLKNTVKKELRK